MVTALRELQKLSDSQREAIATKQVSGSYPIGLLVEKLRALAQFDRTGDRSRKRVGIAIACFGIGAVMTGIFGAATSDDLGRLSNALLVIALVCAAVVAICIVVFVRLRRLDLSDNLNGFALPFLALLKQDVAPTGRVQIRLDLASATEDRKRLETKPAYQLGRYHKVVDTLFHDPWFEGSARLADGTVLRWRVHDTVRESRRTKRNARGKYKTKTRHYKRSEISVAIAFPTKRYLVRDVANGHAYEAELRRDVRRCTIKLSRKVKVKTLDPIDPKFLIDAIALAYRCATPVRRAA